jgi:hypothetical protein
MPIIMPNHYWIVVLSIAVIVLFSLSKFRTLAIIGLMITSTIIFKDYGVTRAFIHILLTILSIAFLKIIILSFRQRTETVRIDE